MENYLDISNIPGERSSNKLVFELQVFSFSYVEIRHRKLRIKVSSETYIPCYISTLAREPILY